MGINELIKIGTRMKNIRKQHGISQKDMAMKLELSNSTYSNYENGHREPPLDVIEHFCQVLSIDATGLLFDNLYDILKNQQKEQTLAAHFDGTEFTEDELDEIRQFAEFVKSRRNSKE